MQRNYILSAHLVYKLQLFTNISHSLLILTHVNYCRISSFFASYHVTIAYDDIIIYVSVERTEVETIDIIFSLKQSLW